jgi:hypothetical protein
VGSSRPSFEPSRRRAAAHGYGEGEAVALAVALGMTLGVAVRSAGLVLWGVVSGRVPSGRVRSSGPARRVVSMLLVV